MTLSGIARAGRVAATLAWSFFLVYAWMTGRLMLIHPSYRWLSLAAAALLGAVAVALLFEEEGHAHGHAHDEGHAHDDACGCGAGCQARSARTELAFQCAVLIPICVSLWLGRGGLSTQAMTTRGVRLMPAAQGPSAAAPTPAPLRGADSPADAWVPASPAVEEETQPPLTLSDIHSHLLLGRRDELEGRKVIVLGQHFVDDRCGPGEFCVVRILVTCCLADAEVMGLLVKPKSAFTPRGTQEAMEAANRLRLPEEPGAMELKMRIQEQGPWVEATGILRAMRDRRGQMIYIVTYAQVKNATPPADILLYPRPMMAW